MKINEIVQEGDDNSPETKKLAAIGRVLMDRAITTKDDALSNLMASFGDALTRYGSPFGPASPEELMKKVDIDQNMMQKLLAYGDAELEKQGDVKSGDDVEEPQDDDDEFEEPTDDEIDRQAAAAAKD
jgi:hypothetical protein